MHVQLDRGSDYEHTILETTVRETKTACTHITRTKICNAVKHTTNTETQSKTEDWKPNAEKDRQGADRVEKEQQEKIFE